MALGARVGRSGRCGGRTIVCSGEGGERVEQRRDPGGAELVEHGTEAGAEGFACLGESGPAGAGEDERPAAAIVRVDTAMEEAGSLQGAEAPRDGVFGHAYCCGDLGGGEVGHGRVFQQDELHEVEAGGLDEGGTDPRVQPLSHGPEGVHEVPRGVMR
jgi:hypothetical protein